MGQKPELLRKQVRRVFTITFNELKALAVDYSENFQKNRLQTLMSSLEDKAERLFTYDAEVAAAFPDDVQEADVQKEFDTTEKYRDDLCEARILYRSRILLMEKLEAVNGDVDRMSVHSQPQRDDSLHTKYRYPKLEFLKFDGVAKNWIGFWGLFRKVHEDSSIDKTEKFQFLLQQMVPDSDAWRLVKSYPPSGENYDKAIEQLKSRFARDEVLIEVYVRELLKLVLDQSKNGKQTQLATLYDKLVTQIRALESLGVTSEKYAAMLYPLVESAIPDDTLLAWERSRVTSHPRGLKLSESGSTDDTDTDHLTLLLEFLKLEVEHEERLNLAKSGFRSESVSKNVGKCVPSASALVSTAPPQKFNQVIPAKTKETNACIFCGMTNHSSSECATAMDMTLKEKNDVVKKKAACFRCLKLYHLSSKCRSYVKCILCKKRHHAIMCDLTEGSSAVKKKEEEPSTAVLFSQGSLATTYLQTLVAKIVSGDQEFRARVLLDSGSQKSYVLKRLAHDLKLKRQGKVLVRQELFGGQKTAVRAHNKYELTLVSMTEPFQCTLEVFDQDTICGFVPKIDDSCVVSWLEKRGIFLSDASTSSPDIDEVHLLLGADAWPILFTNDTLSLNEKLIAVRTRLGWTVIGSTDQDGEVTPALLNVLTCQVNLANFWDLEILGIEDPGAKRDQAQKDLEVDAFFKRTIEWDKEGRYTVQIPWIPGVPNLEDNQNVAKKRLVFTSNKLKALKRFSDYDDVIKMWLDLGIVEKVPEEELARPAYYLPHRAVIKEHSSTPVRPVFDASSVDRNGRSINSCIEKGPNLIALIVSVLTNFRLYKMGLTADIEKAFLQIKIHEKDRDQLRFLWWVGERVVVLRHCRVVFGVSSSPYLLSAVLRFHLENAPAELQDQAAKLQRSSYVDNLLTGADSEEDLFHLQRDAQSLLNSAGFNLRGWVSNIWNSSREELVLGLIWTCEGDELGCNVKLLEGTPTVLTRRTLLSIAQRVYDPLGFITPASIIPKMLLQRSWNKKQGWDEPLTDEVQQEFGRWFSQISSLGKCKVPRHTPLNDSSTVHVFCDASKRAYACCIFVRTDIDGEVVIRLLIAKSRVSPNKELTLPRLELMAALVGVRLYNEVVHDSPLRNQKAYFWTDATVVISWITRQAQWSVFVENRVREIRKTCDEWNHVPGTMNPADLLSRGCSPMQLVATRWWEGPRWLHLPLNEWPRSELDDDDEEVFQEVRKTAFATRVALVSYSSVSAVIERCEKYTKIVRIVAKVLDAICIVCRGFVKYCGLNEELIKSRDICGEKFLNAEIVLIRLAQQEYFSDDMTKASLKKVDTFLDERGLLRLKTRLTKGDQPSNFKSPIILPGKHLLTKKLIFHEHLANKHAGTLTLMMILRERFWILQYRRTVNRVIRKCVVCRRHAAKSFSAPEPPLPRHRISAGAVFQSTGVDLAGPLFLASGEKCWVILFTCCVYRAVHLDLLLSLSSEALIQTLRRFIARRGRPKTIQSDNGTNFTGMENMFKRLDWNRIHEECGVQRIEWKFNPPGAPWWGGHWERLIRIMKDLMKRNLGQASLLQDEMYTLLCECEAIMNNRPLTYLSEEPTELIPLKPSSFLISLAGNEVPDLDNIEENSLSKRYKYLQDVRQGLRNRFVKEYLAFLRTAKKSVEDTVRVGEVVLIGSDKKRIFWPLGRVTQIIPGTDGVVRLVKLWTAKGEIIRPIQNLYPLEVDLSKTEANAKNPAEEELRELGTSPVGSVEAENPAEEECRELETSPVGSVEDEDIHQRGFIDLTEETEDNQGDLLLHPTSTTTRAGRLVRARKIFDL